MAGGDAFDPTGHWSLTLAVMHNAASSRCGNMQFRTEGQPSEAAKMSSRLSAAAPVRTIKALAMVFALCLVVVTSLMLSAVPSMAQSDHEETRILLQDISAYLVRCQAVPSSPPTPLFPLCANEKAQLLRRQHDLHVSDAEVNAQLTGRGGFGRWP